jgi:hypothetical protein
MFTFWLFVIKYMKNLYVKYILNHNKNINTNESILSGVFYMPSFTPISTKSGNHSGMRILKGNFGQGKWETVTKSEKDKNDPLAILPFTFYLRREINPLEST